MFISPFFLVFLFNNIPRKGDWILRVLNFGLCKIRIKRKFKQLIIL